MFWHQHNLLPLDLPSISLINQSEIHNYNNTGHVSDLHIASRNTKLAGNTITTQGPIIWNNMNVALKNCKSLASFKTCLKKYNLDQYSSKIYNNMYASIVWSFTVLYATTVLNVLSYAALHPNLNLIYSFFLDLSLLFTFILLELNFPYLTHCCYQLIAMIFVWHLFHTIRSLEKRHYTYFLTALLEYGSILPFFFGHYYTWT